MPGSSCSDDFVPDGRLFTVKRPRQNPTATAPLRFHVLRFPSPRQEAWGDGFLFTVKRNPSSSTLKHLQLPSEPTRHADRRRPLCAHSEETSVATLRRPSFVDSGTSRSPSSLPPKVHSKPTRRRPLRANFEETPGPPFAVQAACPPSRLQTETPSSALEALWEGSARPAHANIRRPVVVRWKSTPSSLEKKKAADASPRRLQPDHLCARGIGK